MSKIKRMVRVLGESEAYDVSTLHGLQTAHMRWLRHNFPQQLGRVTAEDVQAFVEAVPDGVSTSEAVAHAINSGDPRLVKRHDHGLIGAVEELGELAHERLKMEQGIREGRDVAASERKAKDAVADTILFLISFCNTNGWDLEEIIVETCREVFARDWVAAPRTGRTPENREGPRPPDGNGNEAATQDPVVSRLRAFLRGMVARGWCAPANKDKVMDPDLVEAIVDQLMSNYLIVAGRPSPGILEIFRRAGVAVEVAGVSR